MIKQMKSLFAVAVFFSLYVIASVFKSDLWGNLLAPIIDLLAVGIIFFSIYRSENTKFKLSFTLIGLSVFSWAAADILWVVYLIGFHSNPENSELISVLYAGTNIFLFIAMTLYFTYKFRKWDSVQLLLDSAFISVAVIYLLWVLIFDKNYNSLGFLQQDDVVNMISVLIDMMELILISVWYLSIRKGNIPIFLRVLFASFFFYVLVDIAYFYVIWKNIYIPNSLIDVCYMATFLGFAIGTKLYFVQYPLEYDTQNEQYSNIGHQHRGLVIVLAPIFILIFKGFDWFDILLFIVLIFLHEGFSSYIQAAIDNKKLLERELNINHELEELISERTKDLKYTNDHDSLTDLYNRRYFLRKLEDKAKQLPPNKILVLLLWNVDRLKNINDTYGHSTGDKVLIEIAQRIKNMKEASDELARIGGDEFALVLDGSFAKDEIRRIAKHIVDVCSEPIQMGQYTFHVTISLGVAKLSSYSFDANILLKNADTAMRFAKNTDHGNCISFYTDIDLAIKRNQLIASLLKKADMEEFILYYQPQFCITDQKLFGMEALLRWNCPELGFISPAEFIPIAEDENMIVSIGNWVIENAISQITDWNRSFHSDLKVGINISPKQLDQTDFLEIFKSSMQRHRAKGKWIDIEITEGVAIATNDKAILIQKYFQDEGISISIDDFGTGYSSLGYLNMLSFNRIKIPKPFIDNIVSDKSSLKIVSSIISLARSLDIQTISEGVETREQFDLLSDLGCDQIQGYYLGKPMPSDEFQKTLLIGDKDINS